jgi:2-haloacid dehalogenase
VTTPTAVVFDLGSVLIDWDPRHLYRSLFDDEEAMEVFLRDVASPEWNAQQDAGRTWEEAIDALVREHPDQRDLIVAYRERWVEMLGGAIEPVVEIAAELRAGGIPLFALSNWSAETFPAALERYPFLSWFDGLVISGRIGIAKPDPRIFAHLLATNGLTAGETVFIDDTERNVEQARRLGFRAIRFTGAEALRAELHALGLPVKLREAAGSAATELVSTALEPNPAATGPGSSAGQLPAQGSRVSQ